MWLLYDLQGNWLAEYDSAGAPRQQVIWFAGMPVGVIDRRREGAAQEGARLFYLEADALGTPRAVIDPVSTANPWGKAVWRWELTGEAFGADLPIEDADSDGKRFVLDMRFPGQRYDDVTGLHYNYFRDYYPAVGRYVQSDPIGLEGGVSTYGYVEGVPKEATDRFALWIDLNLFFPGYLGFLGRDPLYDRAEEFRGHPGEISVGAHGIGGQVVGPDHERLTAKQLADLIRRTNKWERGLRTVRLYICDAGNGMFRHELARELGPGAIILAPSDWVWYRRGGIEPEVFGVRQVGSGLVMDPNAPGLWNWTTVDQGYGVCESGCY